MLLHIQSHTSSCPGCVQGGSFDSLPPGQREGFGGEERKMEFRENTVQIISNMFRHLDKHAVSPAQRDLLGAVGVGVLVAVGAAAVFFRRDVETAHLRFGSSLFHAVYLKAAKETLF